MNKLTKYFLIAVLAVLAISFVWLVVLATGADSRAQDFAKGGYDLFLQPAPGGQKASELMAGQSTRAMFHLFLVTMFGGAVMLNLLWLNGAARPALRWSCCGLLALILYVGQWQADSRFMDYYTPSSIYADNAVFQKLRNDPGRPRVALMTRNGFYNTWLSLLFPYWNIDSIDIPAASRPPADYTAFFGVVDRQILRKWELCSVHYVLGPKDGGLQMFKSQKWDAFFTAAFDFDYPPFGKQALFEFSRALPRALVLHRWEVIGEPEKLLARLGDPQFDPHSTALLDAEPRVKADPNAPPMTPVEIVSFKPTRVVLKTRLKSPGLFMLNDRYDDAWTATVDGQPAPVQRANFIMRGVPLDPGEHRVVFSYSIPTTSKWLTWGEWSLITIGLIATGLGALRRRLGK